jgi:hypothetical protein
MTSYQVRFWDIRKITDTARGRYRVRWAVDGREHCKSFAAKALADAFLVTLKDSARDGPPFDPGHRAARPAQAGRPARHHLVRARPRLQPDENGPTWLPSPAARPPRRLPRSPWP